MKINLLAAGIFAAALAMPIGVYAQQSGAQPTRSQSQNMPSEGHLQQHWARRMRSLNLSNDQQQRIQSIIHQYSQSHPEGSPRGHGAMRELRRQLMGTLTSDQQNQFRQAHRGKNHRQGQMQGEYQQGAPDQYQQGMPDQRYQQEYPQQYQQGPPQYQQGGPPPEYQQGGPPPQYQQGGPPPEYQQGGPPPQYPQGGPPPQYQQGPPGGYEQGPPPDAQPQYDQGPPSA
jgi:Spy/CpxP family protein refolding chaperone